MDEPAIRRPAQGHAITGVMVAPLDGFVSLAAVGRHGVGVPVVQHLQHLVEAVIKGELVGLGDHRLAPLGRHDGPVHAVEVGPVEQLFHPVGRRVIDLFVKRPPLGRPVRHHHRRRRRLARPHIGQRTLARGQHQGGQADQDRGQADARHHAVKLDTSSMVGNCKVEGRIRRLRPASLPRAAAPRPVRAAPRTGGRILAKIGRGCRNRPESPRPGRRRPRSA